MEKLKTESIELTNRLKGAAIVFWRKITEDKICFIFSLVSLLFLLFTIYYLLFAIDNLPSEVPLFYSKIWGEKRLAPVSSLWLLPGLGLGLWVFNTVLAVKFFCERDSARLLFFYQVICVFLLTIALIKIVIAVGFI
ncbi:MAG: hypothetical protein Q8N98_00955 [bacterium]|nr:hypothetical protein [bacterium]